MLTLPEDRATVLAQIEAVLSPSSTKDIAYFDKGSQVPEALPKNLIRLETPNGVYITTNRKKASKIKKAKTAEQLEAMNGELLFNKKSGGKGTGLLAVATNQQGLPVAEIGTDPQHFEQDMAEAQAQAPAGGSVAVLPVQQVLGLRQQRMALQNQGG